MKRKKLFLLLLTAIMVIVAAAGCGSNKSGSTNAGKTNTTTSAAADSGGDAKGDANQAAKAKDPVTLEFWAAFDPGTEDGKTIQQKVKEFDDSHDNININLQVITYDVMHDKLVAAVNAGDAPDISWALSEWFGEFNQLDALMDLTSYMDKWEDKDKLYANVMDAMKLDGKVKALPNYLGIRALLYHEQMLKDAGFDAPPKTWDELIGMGKAIKDKTGKEAFGIAGTGVRSPQELMMYLAQNNVQLAVKMDDGKYKNTWQDNPEELSKAAEVFQFYQDLLSKGVIKSDAKTWGWEVEDQNFALDQYAMVINGSWIETRSKDNPEEMKDVKIAPPVYKSKPATFMEIAPLFVYKTKHPEETWEFAKYLMGKDYQSAVNPAKSPRNDIVSDSQWGKDFMALAPQGIVFPSVSLGGITKAMEDALARAMLKKDAPMDVAKWLSTSINDSLSKSGELSGK